MKKIISLLLIVLFAMTAFSTQASAEEAFPKGRTTALGDEPNGDSQPVESTNQAGVTVPGAGTSQYKTCTDCEKSGNILLSSSARRASPGVLQQAGSEGTSSNNGSSATDR